MMQKLQIEDITIDIEYKKIKNIHLRVCPPDGQVRISAPVRVDRGYLRDFAISKLGWIRKQQERIKGAKPVKPAEYLSGEIHYYLGRPYVLQLCEQDSRPHADISGNIIRLHVRPGADAEKRRAVLEEWYRSRLEEALPELFVRWEKVIGVKTVEYRIKRMRTKWGTCNRKARRIWINLELAKKPPECLTYIVVHELVHLLERGHNQIFYGYMDRFLPQWKQYKNELNK
ncbi:MAG TPA: SprT family zinc-dependent metalloprotease [Clostridia bacterium]|nr:SprT family zinc-dependent metalloprotease [Clostridia bacterium]